MRVAHTHQKAVQTRHTHATKTKRLTPASRDDIHAVDIVRREYLVIQLSYVLPKLRIARTNSLRDSRRRLDSSCIL